MCLKYTGTLSSLFSGGSFSSLAIQCPAGFKRSSPLCSSIQTKYIPSLATISKEQKLGIYKNEGAHLVGETLAGDGTFFLQHENDPRADVEDGETESAHEVPLTK